jgi:hypothetical protein
MRIYYKGINSEMSLKKEIPLSELNYQFVTTLDKYFRSDRKCNHNTTAKYIKNFKKIINQSIKLN